MAVTRFTKDMSKISKLPNKPYNDATMTPEKLKAAFDEAGTELKAYVNETLLPEIEAGIIASVTKSGTSEAGTTDTYTITYQDSNTYQFSVYNGANGANGTNGADGTNGTNGVDGTDGREIELQKTSTDIQWRYVGEETWENLFSLADIKGDKGDTGDTGTPGADGADGKGIVSVVRTSGTGAAGTTDTYTITFTDSTTTTFSVYNGANGEGSGDMLKSVYDTDGDGKVDSAENADKVGGFTVGKSVPSNAVFTDTVYSHPTTSGNKHIPSGGAEGQILKYSADGTAIWDSIPSGAQITTGSYTGTGAYGSSNKKTLSASFSIKLVVVLSGTNIASGYTNCGIFINPSTVGMTIGNNAYPDMITSSWASTSVSYYSTIGAYQMLNNSGTTYYYVLIG